MQIAILAESGELGVLHPRERCTPRMKIAILAESGDLGVPHPCECCIQRSKATGIKGIGIKLLLATPKFFVRR